MKSLSDFENEIHKCSKCGLCQAVCPVYQISGNECAVSRGQFLMLYGALKHKFAFSKEIKKYLDLCLKCNACSRFCPSGINVADIMIAAKFEYIKRSIKEKFVSFLMKTLFYIVPKLLKTFRFKTKSRHFDKKVLYFSGCAEQFKNDKKIVKLLNYASVEVITPDFNCCGVSLLMRGDLNAFNSYIKNFIKTVKKYNITEIVTSCASCEGVLKSYIKWADDENDRNFLSCIKIKSIYEYIYENKIKFELKKPVQITYHKPCSENNMSAILWILNNTKNLLYQEAENYDKCCGYSELFNIKEFKVTSKLLSLKRNNIIKTNAKYVLTTCVACQLMLSFGSLNRYKVSDLLDFIEKESNYRPYGQ